MAGAGAWAWGATCVCCYVKSGMCLCIGRQGERNKPTCRCMWHVQKPPSIVPKTWQRMEQIRHHKSCHAPPKSFAKLSFPSREFLQPPNTAKRKEICREQWNPTQSAVRCECMIEECNKMPKVKVLDATQDTCQESKCVPNFCNLRIIQQRVN